MAMRITTKMMQNTSLRNLNTNKARQELLTTQMTTGKKISRPSDDPVIAIRSLRLNASLDKIDQFKEKNAEDAQSWLELTDAAISTVNGILINDVRKNIVQAANGILEYKDRKAIVENLNNAAKEIYATGNADSAGRCLFTGYRTDTSLSFKEDKVETYSITEQFNNSRIDKITYVATGELKNINEGNFDTYDIEQVTQYEVTTNDIYRIRLSYNDNDKLVKQMKADGTEYTDAEGRPVCEPNITFSYGDFSEGGSTTVYSANTLYDENGNAMNTGQIQVRDSGTEEAYMIVVNDPDAVVYIAETGELLLGENVKEKLAERTANTEMRVTYEKSNWQEGDLDPIHYFYTERTQERTGRTLQYNPQFLTQGYNPDTKQIIEYDVGNNQMLRVNTTADELFTHNIGRDIDEVVDMLDEYGVLDDNYNTIKSMIDSEKYDGDELTKLETELEAINKARTMVKDKLQKRCKELITDCDGYIEATTLAETNCGSRESRLNLIKSRLNVQQTNFKELVSENEDADYTELAIQLKSVEMTYEAALSSISYVMQTSLLDFIG